MASLAAARSPAAFVAHHQRAPGAGRSRHTLAVVRCSASRGNPLGAVQAAGTGALAAAVLLMASPASADLNKYEAAAGGEFGIGTALQFGIRLFSRHN